MQKILKSEVIELMKQLREKNYTNEQLAVMLKRTTQTIYAWGSKTKAMETRVPCLAEFEALKRLLEK